MVFIQLAADVLRFAIKPTPILAKIELMTRGEIVTRSIRRALVELATAHCNSRNPEVSFENELAEESGRVEPISANGPGNIMIVELAAEHVTEVFTAFGRVGATAEHVASEAVDQTRHYLAANVPVGRHGRSINTTDGNQCVATPPRDSMRSSFVTMPLTRHSTTHIEILKRILEIDIHVERETNNTTCIVNF